MVLESSNIMFFYIWLQYCFIVCSYEVLINQLILYSINYLCIFKNIALDLSVISLSMKLGEFTELFFQF